VAPASRKIARHLELFRGSTAEAHVSWAGNIHFTTALSIVPASSIEVQNGLFVTYHGEASNILL